MKKILVMLLCVSLSLGVTACGEEKKTEEPKTEQVIGEEKKESEKKTDEEKKESIEVDKHLLSVEITIPASFYESLGITPSEEDLEEEAKNEEDTEYIVNEDGSVTCKMSKSAYKKKMDGFSADIQKSIEEILSDKESYPSIEDITVNSDYSEFTVKTTCNSKDDFSMNEGMINFSLPLSAFPYYMYSEKEPEKILISYINSGSGEVIYTYDSSSDE